MSDDLFTAAAAVDATPDTDTRLTIEALSPIAHGSFGESAGNATLLRRMSIVSVPGMPRVPVISGNALRGVARRLVMRELFARAGLNRETLDPVMWDRLYAALANGGHLDGSEGTVRPDEIRELRASLPPLSVFGAALFSRLLPGHAEVGIAWLRCAETIEGGQCLPGEAPSGEDMVEEVSHCRHIEREQHDPELSGVTPMPTTIEAVSAGARFESLVTFAAHSTALERGAMLHGLMSVQTIGGKGSVGLGRVRVVADRGEDDVAAYRSWLESTDLTDVLRSLAVQLARPGKKKGRK